MSKYLVLLMTLFIALNSQGAENCIQATIYGQKDLATPWPLQEHSERHTQIQRVIALYKRHVQFCTDRAGALSEDLQFLDSAEGTIEVQEASITSEAAECLTKMLSQVRVGNYFCDMNVTYKWNGQFPLLNIERKEF